MIDKGTVGKLIQACALLADVQADLEAHGASIPAASGWADPAMFTLQEQRGRQQAAVEAVLLAVAALPRAVAEVTATWEALGSPEALSSPEAPRKPMITWRASSFSSHHGTAGGIHAFTIHWHTRREDPCYFLSTDLPGLPVRDQRNDDPEVLKAIAEDLLAAWLRLLSGGAA